MPSPAPVIATTGFSSAMARLLPIDPKLSVEAGPRDDIHDAPRKHAVNDDVGAGDVVGNLTRSKVMNLNLTGGTARSPGSCSQRKVSRGGCKPPKASCLRQAAPVSIRQRPDGSTATFPHFVMDRSN